jgi:hypothetical protein
MDGDAFSPSQHSCHEAGMSVDSEHMEHRWGTRVDLDVLAELRTADGRSAEGFLRNASVSGKQHVGG